MGREGRLEGTGEEERDRGGIREILASRLMIKSE